MGLARITRIFYLVILLGLFISCSKESPLEPNNYGTLTVKVNNSYNVTDGVNTKASSSLKAEQTTHTLNGNIMCRILLYKGTTLVTSKDFKVSETLTLQAKPEAYNVIVYSTGLPTLQSHTDNLVTNGEEQFLYYKQNVDLSKTSDLNITLSNFFSQLTVNVISQVGAVERVVTKIDGVYKNPVVNILTGQVDQNSLGTPYELSSTKSNIFFATTNDVVNNIKLDITIGGVTKTKVPKARNIQRGEWWRLDYTLSDANAGYVVGNVEWAKGNLSYTDAKGYYFEENQASKGSYWMWNYPVLKSKVNLPDWQLAQQMNAYSAANDPCTKIAGWRTPSKADFEALLKTKSQYSNDGVLFTNSQLFLPFAGRMTNNNNDNLSESKQGSYWTTNQETNDNGTRFNFGNNNDGNVWTGFNGDYKPHRMSIRCVRSK